MPATASQSLVFTASDPDGDPLSWQVTVGAAAATATGLSLAAPASGATFALQLGPVALPAATTLTVLVEDPRGPAAAIDLRLVRSGAPVLDAVEPGSSFATLPQRVTFRGHGFQLAGTVTPTVTFGAASATDVLVASDTELSCTTPPSLAPGPKVVAVAQVFGTGSLPAAAVTVHAFPPQFAANDQRLGSTAAVTGFDLALDERTAHAVATDAGPPLPALVHQVSSDGGATWSPPQILIPAV